MVTPIPVGAFHVSRQKLARSLDYQEVARNNDEIDRALTQATALVEGTLRRGFFPWYGTRYFDWPTRDNPISWKLRLNDHDLIALYGATAGGVILDPDAMQLYPTSGPPFTSVETTISGNDVYQSGDTWQNAIALTGLWGYKNDVRTVATLAANINDTTTTLTLSNGDVGVGDVILIDSEYMVVRDLRTASTGQTLQTPLTASNANTAVAVSDGTAFTSGDVLTLDAERVLVLDVAGNTLIAKRGWDGTVLATHTGSTIYAPRTYIVDRAACVQVEGPYPGQLYPDVDLYPGLSAATSHTSGTNVQLHVIPAAVEALTLAEASWIYQGHASGWQTAPGTTNRSTATLAALQVLDDLRARAKASVGRKARQRTV